MAQKKHPRIQRPALTPIELKGLMPGSLDHLLGDAEGRKPLDKILSATKPSIGQLAAQEVDGIHRLSEKLHPTDTDMQRIGEMLNAFFGEFNTAVRTYAFAKHGENMTPEIEAFMENQNPDVTPQELYKLGWPSVSQLLGELSMPVMHMQEIRRQNKEDMNSPDIKSPAAIALRDNKILPVLLRYAQAHGMYELGATPEERKKDVADQIPGYAMVVEALMHNLTPETKGLRYAIMKKAQGETLNDQDKAALEASPDIVETVESMMASAGNGYATKPCNQIYRAAMAASQQWSDFIKEETIARGHAESGGNFMAQHHYAKAMEYHKESLGTYRRIHEALGPVVEMIDGMIDSPGVAEISDEKFGKATDLVRRLPEIGNNDKIKYNVTRIANAIEAVFKNRRPEYDTVVEYATRSARVNQFAETSKKDAERLEKQIEVLKEAVKESGGSIPIRDERFRDVYMGLRALSDRIEMMQISAEQLYVDMGRITGKQNAEWLAHETKAERDQFTLPKNPSDKLKKVAEEIQRNCMVQHEVATNCRKELLEMVQDMGSSVDRFDVIHDFFSRLRSTIGEQVKSMEARQAVWDNAHGGVGITVSR